VRVATKHLTAILAAYALYTGMKGQNNENALFAKFAAMGSYVAATKAIAASERADTRAWATLPRALRVTDVNLPAGRYQVGLARKLEQNAPGDVHPLGEIMVPAEGKAVFTYLRPQM
jgi:hypothetical protein